MSHPKDFNNQSRIALVDEFFARFNGEVLSPFADKRKPDYMRVNLLTLFDMAAFKSKKDPKYLSADSLVSHIIDTQTKIHFSDSDWVAVAPCKATLGGKATKLTLSLLVEKRGDDMYKWVIAKANGEILDTPAPTEELMLLPTEHETNFIALHRMTDDTPKQSEAFARHDYRRDNLTAFFTLVRQGALKINAVEGLTFVLFQIPGYVIDISYISRDSHNSGWLITSFEKMEETEKKAYFNQLTSNN